MNTDIPGDADMNKKSCGALLSAAAMAAVCTGTASAAHAPVDITVYPAENVREISPMIYGVNSGTDLSKVTAKAFRLGGNRLSAYNWENNMSNAGSDRKNFSDKYLVTGIREELRTEPAGVQLNALYEAHDNNIPYTLLTLQMLGYTASGKSGSLDESKSPPSEYWKQVVNRKNSPIADTPDKKDECVYMDEFLSYLMGKAGSSESETGCKAYSLDNEPALWQHTHSLVQREPLSCKTLIDKSVDLAALVKEYDRGADVFGPALYGYSAFVSLGNAPDWEEIKADKGYRWFIDYYLDEMRKASEEKGTRLLDVLDIHFYTEARGECGERSCSHYDNDGCIKARLDSVRSLYEEGYREDSWISETGAEFFPLLPNVISSVNTYYPETRIAFSEYNFGGGDHISGGVAQADTLGIFAENGVYFAALWSFDKNEYQLAAINMFTNYDGCGSGFGDTLVKSEHGEGDISVYSSVNSGGDDTVKIIITNRSIHEETPVSISLSSDKKYSSAKVFTLSGDSAEITGSGTEVIKDNGFSRTLPPLSVTAIEVRADKKSSGAAIAIGAGIAAAAAGAAGAAAIKKRKN